MNGSDFIYEALYEIGNDTMVDVGINEGVLGLATPQDNSSLTYTAMKLKLLREEINGQTLNITFLDDYPLSYSVEGNSSRGMGVAFELLEFLTEKFNFTFELVRPEKNIFGSSDQYNGSIIEMLETEVLTNYRIYHSPILEVLKLTHLGYRKHKWRPRFSPL